eukprot:7381521-Prymnesium_polylepis.3
MSAFSSPRTNMYPTPAIVTPVAASAVGILKRALTAATSATCACDPPERENKVDDHTRAGREGSNAEDGTEGGGLNWVPYRKSGRVGPRVALQVVDASRRYHSGANQIDVNKRLPRAACPLLTPLRLLLLTPLRLLLLTPLLRLLLLTPLRLLLLTPLRLLLLLLRLLLLTPGCLLRLLLLPPLLLHLLPPLRPGLGQPCVGLLRQPPVPRRPVADIAREPAALRARVVDPRVAKLLPVVGLQVCARHVVDRAEAALPALARIGHLLPQLRREQRSPLLDLEAGAHLRSDALHLRPHRLLRPLEDLLRLACNRKQRARVHVRRERRLRDMPRNGAVGVRIARAVRHAGGAADAAGEEPHAPSVASSLRRCGLRHKLVGLPHLRRRVDHDALEAAVAREVGVRPAARYPAVGGHLLVETDDARVQRHRGCRARRLHPQVRQLRAHTLKLRQQLHLVGRALAMRCLEPPELTHDRHHRGPPRVVSSGAEGLPRQLCYRCSHVGRPVAGPPITRLRQVLFRILDKDLEQQVACVVDAAGQ